MSNPTVSALEARMLEVVLDGDSREEAARRIRGFAGGIAGMLGYSDTPGEKWLLKIAVAMETEEAGEPGLDLNGLAREIAADLFVDGQGKPAKRLVMERHGGRIDGCGWAEVAVRDRVLKILRRSTGGAGK